MMLNYDTASDFDINCGVAKALGYALCDDDFYLEIFKERYPNRVWSIRPGHEHAQHNDYCNNPGDMWPIIVEYKIGIHPAAHNPKDPNKKEWQAVCGVDGYLIYGDDSNPLRCAAIVYLKLMEDAP